MGALFDGPYRPIAKTGLRPVLTIRPPVQCNSFLRLSQPNARFARQMNATRVGNPDIGIGIFSGLDPTFPDRNFGIGNFSGFTPDLQNGSGSGPDRESRRDPDEISGLSYFARFSIKQLLS